MDADVKNFLYRNPDLYDVVYHGSDNAAAKMCERMFRDYLKKQPTSILDIGSGTGRDLDYLSEKCKDCVGIDYQEQMVEFARTKFPKLNFSQGDMRELRLDRKFDAILCLGWAFTYALTNEDIAKTLTTFATHAQEGALLVLSVINGVGYLPGGLLSMEDEFEISNGRHTGQGSASYTIRSHEQLLVRERVWDIPGLGRQEDFCKFRLFFPAELKYFLAVHGFEIVGIFDNPELRPGELLDRSLFVASIFRGRSIH